jgi:hypothetical protein
VNGSWSFPSQNNKIIIIIIKEEEMKNRLRVEIKKYFTLSNPTPVPLV